MRGEKVKWCDVAKKGPLIGWFVFEQNSHLVIVKPPPPNVCGVELPVSKNLGPKTGVSRNSKAPL